MRDRTSSSSSSTATLEGECSCMNSKARKDCCQRVAVRAHKFGYMLVKEVFQPYKKIIQASFLPENIPRNPNQDYRHVAVIRNVFAAMVSGYLYHKSGRECWSDVWGRNVSEPIPNLNWDRFVLQSKELFQVRQYPLAGNRSLCLYLSQVPEEIGVSVFMSFMLFHAYRGIIEYMEKSRQRDAMTGQNRTLFVCLEDASDPTQQDQILVQMMDWLFPGGHHHHPTALAPGGHGTSRDPELRPRLLALVKQLDREILDNRVAAINSYIDCSESYR